MIRGHVRISPFHSLFVSRTLYLTVCLPNHVSVCVCVCVCVCSVYLSLALSDIHIHIHTGAICQRGGQYITQLCFFPLSSFLYSASALVREKTSDRKCLYSSHRVLPVSLPGNKDYHSRQVFRLAPSFHFLLCFICIWCTACHVSEL